MGIRASHPLMHYCTCQGALPTGASSGFSLLYQLRRPPQQDGRGGRSKTASTWLGQQVEHAGGRFSSPSVRLLVGYYSEVRSAFSPACGVVIAYWHVGWQICQP